MFEHKKWLRKYLSSVYTQFIYQFMSILVTH